MTLENVIQNDPTLKYLIRDSKFDKDLLEHQMNVRCAAIMVAISHWLDYRIADAIRNGQ